MSKRTERSSSSSSTDSAVYQEAKLRKVEILEMTTERDELTIKKIHSALELLTKHIDNRFAELSNELSTFRLEIQAEVKCIKENLSEQAKSLNELWTGNEEQEDKLYTFEKQQDETEKEIAELKEKLKEQKQRNINLEAYTRSENLIFRNIPEGENEDTGEIIRKIVKDEMGLNVDSMRFHAIHRLGKPCSVRTRPIIARFVCREDRDMVFAKRYVFRESSIDYDKVYITLDYPKEIQMERAELVMAMKKAHELGERRAQVLGRLLVIGYNRYSVANIPNAYKG